jgi:hypothetical protein
MAKKMHIVLQKGLLLPWWKKAELALALRNARRYSRRNYSSRFRGLSKRGWGGGGRGF